MKGTLGASKCFLYYNLFLVRLMGMLVWVLCVCCFEAGKGESRVTHINDPPRRLAT